MRDFIVFDTKSIKPYWYNKNFSNWVPNKKFTTKKIEEITLEYHYNDYSLFVSHRLNTINTFNIKYYPISFPHANNQHFKNLSCEKKMEKSL